MVGSGGWGGGCSVSVLMQNAVGGQQKLMAASTEGKMRKSLLVSYLKSLIIENLGV